MHKPINVLSVLIRAEGGGAEASVRRMLEPLLRVNVNVTRVVCSPPKKAEASHELTVLSKGSSQSLFSLLKAAKNLRNSILELQPHIVHLHCERPELTYVVARLIWPSCKTAVVFTEHTSTSYQHQRLAGLVARFFLARWGATQINCFATSDSKIKTIFNPISFDNLDVKMPPSDSLPRLVYIGRLIGLKRVDQIIEAMHESQFQGGLLVVGDGPERAALQNLVETLGVPRVSFAGYQREPWSGIIQSDVFVSASSREGEPLSVVEAICRRVPMLLSDIPAHNSLAENRAMIFGARGELVKALARLEETIEVIRPSQAWANVIRSAREPANVALEWRKVYEEVLGDAK